MPGKTKFESGPIREPGRFGAWWLEGTKERRNIVPAGWVLLAIGIGLVVYGYLQMDQHGPFALAWWLYAVPLLVAGPVMILTGRTPRREIVFTGGETLTPLGTHGDPKSTGWPDLPLDRIARIEAGARGLGVFVLDTAGSFRLIADRLTEAESRTVVAELTNALEAARA